MAVIALYNLQPYYKEFMARRSLASANDPARVKLLNKQKEMTREKQQDQLNKKFD